MSVDTLRAIIEPRKGRSEKSLPPLGVLVFTPQDLDYFLNWIPQCEKCSHKINFADVYIGVFKAIPIAVVGPMLGAPQTILVLEKLIALGVKKVIAVGWCGTLQSHVHIGDLVLPTSAISEEGTSGHYAISESRPGPAGELLDSLKRTCQTNNVHFNEGMIWTTDAPYRETVEKVLYYQERNVIGVEMEVSALFTVAHFRSIKLAAILAVSDDLSSLKWRHGFREERFKEVRRKLPELVINALCST